MLELSQKILTQVTPAGWFFTGLEGLSFLAFCEEVGLPVKYFLAMPDDLASWVRIAVRLRVC